MSTTFERIRSEFDDMLQTGTIPCFEFEMVGGDWLLVDISLNEKGVTFSFDTDTKPVYFDGDIETIDDNFYILPYESNEDFNLDAVLELIHENIVDGFLIPNNLYI
jgi:hypothetical protein